MSTEHQEHNPAGLTPEQIGVAEGWRLLDMDEVGCSHKEIPEIQARSNMGGVWTSDGAGFYGASTLLTYRTKLTRAELRQARGLEPENINNDGSFMRTVDPALGVTHYFISINGHDIVSVEKATHRVFIDGNDVCSMSIVEAYRKENEELRAQVHHLCDDLSQYVAGEGEVQEFESKIKALETLQRNTLENVKFYDAALALTKTQLASLQEVMENLKTQLLESEAARDRMRALVLKLKEIHDNPKFQSVWTLHQVHHGPYSGPTYKDEFEAAIKAAESPSAALEESIKEAYSEGWERRAIRGGHWSSAYWIIDWKNSQTKAKLTRKEGDTPCAPPSIKKSGDSRTKTIPSDAPVQNVSASDAAQTSNPDAPANTDIEIAGEIFSDPHKELREAWATQRFVVQWYDNKTRGWKICCDPVRWNKLVRYRRKPEPEPKKRKAAKARKGAK